MKVVINGCYGGFSLSDEAEEMLCKIKGIDVEDFDYWDIDRNDADLVVVVEKLGEDADGSCASLEVVEVPDEATDWRIDEYDGAETLWYVVDGKMRSV